MNAIEENLLQRKQPDNTKQPIEVFFLLLKEHALFFRTLPISNHLTYKSNHLERG